MTTLNDKKFLYEDFDDKVDSMSSKIRESKMQMSFPSQIKVPFHKH